MCKVTLNSYYEFICLFDFIFFYVQTNSEANGIDGDTSPLDCFIYIEERNLFNIQLLSISRRHFFEQKHNTFEKK